MRGKYFVLCELAKLSYIIHSSLFFFFEISLTFGNPIVQGVFEKFPDI